MYKVADCGSKQALEGSKSSIVSYLDASEPSDDVQADVYSL
jgi:hypothetical protein